MEEEYNDENVNDDYPMMEDESNDEVENQSDEDMYLSVRNVIQSAYRSILLALFESSSRHHDQAGATNTARSLFMQVLDRELEKSYMEMCTESTTQTVEDLYIYDFMHNLEKMLETGQYSDITIKCDDREYKAHRNILAAQSSVFKEMMKQNKDSGIINIEDCEPDIFTDLLHFMYSGRVQNLNLNNVKDLYIAASKFEIIDLCDVCSEYLMYSISEETFFDIIVFSVRYQRMMLFHKVAMFFIENSAAIVESSKWASFLNENEKIGTELLKIRFVIHRI